MGKDLTPEEIEAQWQEWASKHPNPSGLPVQHPLRRGQAPVESHVEEGQFSKLRNLLTVPGPLKVTLPAIRWVGSPNFSPNRDGHNPNFTPSDPTTWIVLHTMDGFMAGTISAFLSVARQASSNYGVGMDGSIVQFVKETDAPWTNGTYSTNPGSNLDSITIECEDGGNYNGPRTPELYESVAQLVADISKRRGIPLVHRGTGGGVLRHKECATASTACPDSLDIDRIIARAIEITQGVNPIVTPTGPSYVKPTLPVDGVIFDSPTNDRSYLDYATVTYVPGQIADIGKAIAWTESKLAVEPSTGITKWLDHLNGTNWGVWDDCVDDGGFSPPHYLPAIPVDVASPAVFELANSVAIVNMLTDSETGKFVSPGQLTTAFTRDIGSIKYVVTQYSHDHNENLGMRMTDVSAALAPVPPVVIPPVTPPVITPPVISPIVDPTPQNLWDAIVAFFRKWFNR